MSEAICKKCGERMRVRTSYRVEDWQKQQLECKCGNEGVRTVPANSVWRRKPKG